VQALIMSSDEVNYEFEILKAVEKVNALQKLHLVQKIKAYFKNDLQGKHFALWGLAFKPNTDDIREAPALAIIDALTSAGATVTAYDPEAMPNVKAQIKDKIKFAENQYEALEGAAALIIATEWSEFRTPDFEQMDQQLKHNKIIFDGRNLFDVNKMKELGYHYESIGRANA
jgi:UDPglucose 6-dehydrogenase